MGSPDFRVVWRYRWWLCAFALIAAASAYGLSGLQDKEYEAEARLRIVPSQQLSGVPLDPGVLDRLVDAYVELARSRPVLQRAVDASGMDVTTGDLRAATGVDADRAAIITIQATAGTGSDAARYANALADALRAAVTEAAEEARRGAADRINRRVLELRTRLRRARAGTGEETALLRELEALSSRLADVQAGATDQARVVEVATAPAEASSPKPLRDALLGAVAALVLGAGLAYARFAVSNRYQSPEDAADDLHLLLLGEIPQLDPDAPDTVDAFRVLRTNLEFAVAERLGSGPPERLRRDAAGNSDHRAAPAGAPSRWLGRQMGRRRARPPVEAPHVPRRGAVLLVTSAEAQAGKTYVTANLARAFASEGERVIAVDTDLRRPALHERCGIPREPGITNVVDRPGAGAAELPRQRVELGQAAARRGGVLDAVGAGRPTDESTEILSSEEMAALVDRLTEDYAAVVLDSPPVLGVTDAAILARYVDGVILVVDSRRTTRRRAHRAVGALRAVQAPLIGIAFNRVSRHETYGYGYGYQPRDEPVSAPAAR